MKKTGLAALTFGVTADGKTNVTIEIKKGERIIVIGCPGETAEENNNIYYDTGVVRKIE